MCQFFVVILLISELTREFSRRDGQRGFVSRIAFTENEEANIIPEKAIEQRHQNLEALFLDDPGHHAPDWTAGRRRELHFLQQRVPANLFSLQLSHVVVCRKQTIRYRIPARIIRAVQNRGNAVCVFPQHTIETMATSRREYRTPVMFAHGCDFVGVENPAFEKIQPSKKFDAVEGEKSFRQVR